MLKSVGEKEKVPIQVTFAELGRVKDYCFLFSIPKNVKTCEKYFVSSKTYSHES